MGAASTVASLLVNIIAGLLLLLVSFILQSINDATRAWNDVLLYLFYLSPPFCLGKSLIAIFAFDAVETMGQQFGLAVTDDSVTSVVSLWSYHSILNIATPCTYMAITTGLFFALTLFLQHHAGCSPWDALKLC